MPWSYFRWCLLTVLLTCAGLATVGCATTPPQVIEKPVITYVDRPIMCPPEKERDRLRDLRPTPLRDQPMPTSAVERNAKAQAQLGLYEAEGGYADQVDAALDRCQQP